MVGLFTVRAILLCALLVYGLFNPFVTLLVLMRSEPSEPRTSSFNFA